MTDVNVANIQVTYYMVAATGVLIAAIYYIINLRFNRRARAMEICRLHTSYFVSEQGMQRYMQVMSLEYKNFEDFTKKYAYDLEIGPKFVAVLMMLEASGIIIKNKVVKPELFYDLGACGAIATWEKFKDFIQRYRALYSQDQLRNAEFLVQEMQKIRTRNAAQFKTR